MYSNYNFTQVSKRVDGVYKKQQCMLYDIDNRTGKFHKTLS